MTGPRRTAGIVSRGMAALIDLFVLLALLAGLYLGVTFVIFILDVRSFAFPTLPWIFSTAGLLVAAVLYLTISVAAFGRTAGHLFLGLRVCRRRSDGAPHVVAAAIRAAVCTIFPLGLLWVAFSPNRRAVHDLLARTVVVYSGR